MGIVVAAAVGLGLLLLFGTKLTGAKVSVSGGGSSAPSTSLNIIKPGTNAPMTAQGMNFAWKSSIPVDTIDNNTDPMAQQLSFLPNGATSGTIVLTKPGTNSFTVNFKPTSGNPFGQQGQLSVTSG